VACKSVKRETITATRGFARLYETLVAASRFDGGYDPGGLSRSCCTSHSTDRLVSPINMGNDKIHWSSLLDARRDSYGLHDVSSTISSRLVSRVEVVERA